jgi:hypothetical protein
MSVRRFKVMVKLDGTSEVTVEITPTAGKTDAVVAVRPKHKRIVYTGLLSDVALIVASRHAKALAAANGISVPKPRKLRK